MEILPNFSICANILGYYGQKTVLLSVQITLKSINTDLLYQLPRGKNHEILNLELGKVP